LRRRELAGMLLLVQYPATPSLPNCTERVRSVAATCGAARPHGASICTRLQSRASPPTVSGRQWCVGFYRE
jgi:hypothetical protein